LGGFLKSLKPKRTRIVSVLIILFLIIGIGIYLPAYAGRIGDFFGQVFALMFYGVAYILGWLTMQVFSLVIAVAGFQEFVDNPGVITGWTIIRDICNMFFVVILLIIAFATILRIEKYSIKSLLPKVIFAAVAINFSKLICGLIIDFGQIVMLTFVNGFQASAGANLINGLQMDTWMKAKEGGLEEINFWKIALTLALAAFMFFFVLMVSILMLVILLARIAFLWILIILSPFAFVGSLLPFTQSLAKQWWQKFGNWVATGPILAFFLWLALLMMQADGGVSQEAQKVTQSAEKKSGVTNKQLQSGTQAVGSTMPNMAQFAMGVALLYGSVVITKQMGGAVGAAVGGKVLGAVKGAAYGVTGARFVGERYKAAKGVLERRRAERVSGFGRRFERGWERTAGVAREAVVGAVKAPVRAPIAAARRGRAEYRRIREEYKEKGMGGGVRAGLAVGVYSGLKRMLTMGAPELASDVRSQVTRAKGASNEAGKARVGKEFKQLQDSKYDAKKSAKAMTTESNMEKAAAHLINAIKGNAINEDNQEDMMKVYRRIKGTPFEKAVEDEVNKNHAFAKYDLSTYKGRKDLIGDQDKNKTNLRDQSASFYKDGNAILTLSQAFGKNFESEMKRIFAKGGDYSKNAREGLAEAQKMKENMTVTDPATGQTIATGRLAELRNLSPSQGTDEAAELDALEAFNKTNFKSVEAKITENPFDAFGADLEGLGNHTSKLDVRDLANALKVDDKGNFTKGDDTQRMIIAQNISTSKLSGLMKTGNDNMVKAVLSLKAKMAQGDPSVPAQVTSPQVQKNMKAEFKNISNNKSFYSSLPPEMQKTVDDNT